jgi:hypothetical protein
MGSIIGEGSLCTLQQSRSSICFCQAKGWYVVQAPANLQILETFIAESKPDALVKVYNAATAAGTDLRHVETEWIKYDLLIYSPSISSGVSFVAKHLTAL